MESKAILLFAFFIFINHINARSYYIKADSEDSNTDNVNNWEISNTLEKPKLIVKRSAAKQQLIFTWLIEAIKEFIEGIPRNGLLVVPSDVIKDPVEIPRDEYNRTVRPWTARVPLKYLGRFPYDYI